MDFGRYLLSGFRMLGFSSRAPSETKEASILQILVTFLISTTFIVFSLAGLFDLNSLDSSVLRTEFLIGMLTFILVAFAVSLAATALWLLVLHFLIRALGGRASLRETFSIYVPLLFAFSAVFSLMYLIMPETSYGPGYMGPALPSETGATVIALFALLVLVATLYSLAIVHSVAFWRTLLPMSIMVAVVVATLVIMNYTAQARYEDRLRDRIANEPDHCGFADEFSCTGIATPNGVNISITNIGNEKNSVTVRGSITYCPDYLSINLGTMKTGDTKTAAFNCSNPSIQEIADGSYNRIVVQMTVQHFSSQGERFSTGALGTHMKQ